MDESRAAKRKSETKMSMLSLSSLWLSSIALSIVVAMPLARAEESTGGMDEIEGLFSKDEATVTEPEKPKATPAPQPGAAATPKPDVKAVTDLSKLQPFNDIAVVQKRYMPKSGRFEFYVAPALMLNDAFFFDFGAAARVTYYFQERYGLEIDYNYLTTTNRKVTNDLGGYKVKTQTFVSPQGYYGADFKWTPVYGKMSWRNQHITPFDLYFSIGAGLTPTNQSTSSGTLHLGVGQVFAFSKGGGLRWDFSWFMYSSTSTTNGGSSSSIYNNLLFSLGWSFFVPEATYR